MRETVFARLVRATTILLALVLGQQGPAFAGDPPDFELVLPMGLACNDFDLGIAGRDANYHTKDFKDKDGNVVRTIFAGKGHQLTFTNGSTGARLTLKSNGFAQHITINPDGSQTWVTTGHSVLIMFPTDVPAGPSTTFYVGQVVFVVDTAGVFTLQRTKGKSTDICAALSA